MGSETVLEIPSWLSASLSKQDAERIEAAVRAAEKKTSAEIVPMIVHRSTLKATGDRIVFWICFGILGVAGAMAFSLLGGLDEALLDSVLETLGVWPTSQLHTILSFVAEAVVALAAFGFAWAVSRWLSSYDSIQRRAFPAGDLTFEAEHRAWAEFNSSDLRATSSRVGVLLFVSMLEHRAVILADKGILAKLDTSVWTKTLQGLLTAIREGRMGDGYVQAIESMANLLAPAFPVQAGDRNELSDRLRILE